MFEVLLSDDARDFYASADQPLAKRLARCFKHLEADPRSSNNIKRLTGDLSAYYRYRVGDWRVVYRIDAEEKQVLVVLIAHRRDVYE